MHCVGITQKHLSSYAQIEKICTYGGYDEDLAVLALTCCLHRSPLQDVHRLNVQKGLGVQITEGASDTLVQPFAKLDTAIDGGLRRLSAS